MIKNIGETIKKVAVALFVIGILASFILYTGLGSTQSKSYSYSYPYPSTAKTQTTSIVYLISGIIISFIVFIFIYGFGELISQSIQTNEKFDQVLAALPSNGKPVNNVVHTQSTPKQYQENTPAVNNHAVSTDAAKPTEPKKAETVTPPKPKEKGYIVISKSQIECSNCGSFQWMGKEKCSHCGQEFTYDKES